MPTVKDNITAYNETDEKKELREIISIIDSAREMLDNLISRYDGDVTELDEAVDALSDAAEILEDVWGE